MRDDGSGNAVIDVINILTDEITSVGPFAGTMYAKMAINPVTHELFLTFIHETYVTVINGDDLSYADVEIGDFIVTPPIIPNGYFNLAVNYLENKVYLISNQYCYIIFNRNDNSATYVNSTDGGDIYFHPEVNRAYTSAEVNNDVIIIDGQADDVMELHLPYSNSFYSLSMQTTQHTFLIRRKFFQIFFDDYITVLPYEPFNGGQVYASQDIMITSPVQSADIQFAVANQTTGRAFFICSYHHNFITVIQDR